jgi:hypothetical protein
MSQKNQNIDLLDLHQIQQRVFDSSKDVLRVQNVAGTLPWTYDYVALVLSNGNTTETYTFRDGGVGGTIVGTVVINYTASDRDVMLNASITAV